MWESVNGPVSFDTVIDTVSDVCVESRVNVALPNPLLVVGGTSWPGVRTAPYVSARNVVVASNNPIDKPMDKPRATGAFIHIPPLISPKGTANLRPEHSLHKA